mmetsp:Transcript_15113/g.43875  ORF Transcript_15113/g.43875 Transcript_15113/m.43875 type:complete len:80 (+) Transcript_15113:324-563(+)
MRKSVSFKELTVAGPIVNSSDFFVISSIDAFSKSNDTCFLITTTFIFHAMLELPWLVVSLENEWYGHVLVAQRGSYRYV